MTISSPSDPVNRRPISWASILQFSFSILAALFLFAAAGFFAFSGLSTYFTQGQDPADLTQPFMVAASLIFAGVLVLPSAWYAYKQLAHPAVQPQARPEPRGYGLVLTIIVLIATSLALFAGNLIAQDDQIAWLFLPVLNIIATGLPALWLIYFGTRGLLPNSPRHKWGVFATGLVLGPAIILFLEIILLVVVGVIAITLLILQNPSLSNQLNGLMVQLRSSGTDTQAILNTLLPYVLNPVIIFLGLAFISVLVPLIEETFKPIGVWFMAGNRITPAMGFGFGVLSGAGFGLFENLGNTSGAGSDWAVLAGSRITTLLLHSFTAGLVGWALASAWSERRFLRLAFSFTIAVLIHGFWNGMAVVSAGASLQGETTIILPSWLQVLASVATLGIFALGLLVVFGFFGFNAYLRRSVRQVSITPTREADALSNPGEPYSPPFPIDTPATHPNETDNAEYLPSGAAGESEITSPETGDAKSDTSDIT
jgi:RsiW-degrading membrane proteinase PrsW (M82 family)